MLAQTATLSRQCQVPNSQITSPRFPGSRGIAGAVLTSGDRISLLVAVMLSNYQSRAYQQVLG